MQLHRDFTSTYLLVLSIDSLSAQQKTLMQHLVNSRAAVQFSQDLLFQKKHFSI